jgi:Predicted hydrolases or acyltransferases (alpha/beta hydrolase superfamily)
MAVQNLVLIHGWASDKRIWQKTENCLAQKNRVDTLDLPSMQHRYSYRDAVLELIEEKGLDQVILAGWSMGALVALQAALELPQIIQGLILISGTGKFVSDTQYPGGIPAIPIIRMKKRLNKNAEQTFKDFYKLMFSDREQMEGLAEKVITSHLEHGRTWDISDAQAGLDFLLEVDLRSELEGITCPTLLLHGKQDEICPLAGAVFIQQQMPCARLISYPGVGHIPFLTNPEDFQRDLEGWLTVYGK